MSCEKCTQFLKFDSVGIQEVPGDGMCRKSGIDKPKGWFPVMLGHHCMNYQDKDAPLVKPMAIRPVIQGKPEVKPPEPEADNKCKDCANWKRDGFTEFGECFSNDSFNKGLRGTGDNSCPGFHQRPGKGAMPGDIIGIGVGDQWRLRYVGPTYIVVDDRQGKEKVFNKAELRIWKC